MLHHALRGCQMSSDILLAPDTEVSHPAHETKMSKQHRMIYNKKKKLNRWNSSLHRGKKWCRDPMLQPWNDMAGKRNEKKEQERNIRGTELSLICLSACTLQSGETDRELWTWQIRLPGNPPAAAAPNGAGRHYEINRYNEARLRDQTPWLRPRSERIILMGCFRNSGLQGS